MSVQRIFLLIKNCLFYSCNFIKQHNPLTKSRLKAFACFVRDSWKSIALLAPLVICTYYIVGGWATNHINRNTDYKVARLQQGLSVVDNAAFLIKREVDDYMWTPNLPFVFPGYMLDNMPQFQRGIIWSQRVLIGSFAKHFVSDDLQQAAKLLNYPEDVWLLSKTGDLALAPSSGAQYRKARKALLNFNQNYAFGDTSSVLADTLMLMRKKMGNIDSSLLRQVREESNAWFDMQADNVFYYNQGRLYGFYTALKALAVDFETEILAAEQYEAWTSMLKTMEDGLRLDPLFIRNGRLNSVMAPNHLLAMDFYVVRSRYQLSCIIDALLKE